jgi:malate dehydrogenase (oxaloacetate-decarboxylating)(NADP+)
MILEDGPLFIADTQVHPDPTPEQVVDVAIGAVRHARRFGVTPKVALCSHSQFGNLDTPSGIKMRAAMEHPRPARARLRLRGRDACRRALDPEIRDRLCPATGWTGSANILVFANTDAASGVRNILKMKAGGLEVGPILMGMGNRAHVVTPSITARGLLNMSAIAGTPVAHYS